MNAQIRFSTNNIKAVMFGAIGVIAETSKLQFDAFNQAFKDTGLGWHWTRDAYLEMLTDPGGINRIEKYATSIGHQLEAGQAERVYNKKSQIFAELLASTDLQPRPGVAALIEQCKANSVKVAWVTTTTEQNIDAMKTALSSKLSFDDFEFILFDKHCKHKKPAPDIYIEAIKRLDEENQNAIAIEDSSSGVASVRAAQLQCLATPGDFGSKQDFSSADCLIDDLSLVHVSGDGESGICINTL